LTSIAACAKSPALPSNLVILWIDVGWIGVTHQ